MPDLQALLDQIDQLIETDQMVNEAARIDAIDVLMNLEENYNNQCVKIAPQLAKALRAVMDVHQKTEHQRAYGFPRADKWEHYCTEDNQSWPCPTVQAITDALGADDE